MSMKTLRKVENHKNRPRFSNNTVKNTYDTTYLTYRYLILL